MGELFFSGSLPTACSNWRGIAGNLRKGKKKGVRSKEGKGKKNIEYRTRNFE
jgi:hypothetical protein